uniref:ATP synthase CF0 subunit I n=1 Tax=Haraldiophyllum bonnemaisonii TaxID=167977 RepID=A0A4D6WZM7_9FLOR|nr:ATP synthase CF0 subunit I [Haraldiophyllum bonnemaisonii]
MQIFQLISQEYSKKGISFNSHFLEANVLNIFILLFGLIYVLKQFLGSILLVRQEKVLFAIKESEERLEQANIRLNEAEKQLLQTQIIINEIIKEAELTAQKVRQSILEQGKYDIEKLTESSKISIKSAENQVKQQIRQKITALAISKVSLQLKNQMTPEIQMKIIDNSIMQLKGDINI